MYSYYRKQCPPGTVFYTIRPRDTLYGIAIRYKVFLNDLIKANPGINPYFLMIGQVSRGTT
jgi:LysM repeat protein